MIRLPVNGVLLLWVAFCVGESGALGHNGSTPKRTVQPVVTVTEPTGKATGPTRKATQPTGKATRTKRKIEKCLHGTDCENCLESQVKYFSYYDKDTDSEAQVKMCCSGCGRKRNLSDVHLDKFCRCADPNSAPKFAYIVKCLFDEECDICSEDETIQYDDGTNLEITACCPKCSEYISSGTDENGDSYCYCRIPDGIDGNCWKGIQCKKCPGNHKSIDDVPLCCAGCKDREVEIDGQNGKPSCNCFKIVGWEELAGIINIDDEPLKQDLVYKDTEDEIDMPDHSG